LVPLVARGGGGTKGIRGEAPGIAYMRMAGGGGRGGP
jgi:hypothetical protein